MGILNRKKTTADETEQNLDKGDEHKKTKTNLSESENMNKAQLPNL